MEKLENELKEEENKKELLNRRLYLITLFYFLQYLFYH